MNLSMCHARRHRQVSASLWARSGVATIIVAYDDHGNAVAAVAVTVWSAGPGKPGLLEPMGVHRQHRGHGYGKVITVAAAAALQELGSSSAIVCTRSLNVGAVGTYKSAGFQQLPEIRDLCRDASLAPACPAAG
jgi:ribosomal protein S18 acetylase RimI-like enzyme